MKNFEGIIIKESLKNKNVLQKIKINKTKTEQVTDKHKTPWIKQWTLHTVEIPENEVYNISKKISESLDPEHNWYADFKNNNFHYIIFRNKVFKVDRSKPEQYSDVTKYGISLGIPDYQLDFLPHI